VKVQVQCEHPRGQVAAVRLRRRARTFLARLGKEDAELSILLVGDRGMRRLNRSWLGKDVPTDVLSFPAAPSVATAGRFLGDVVLSLDTAARVARAERRPVAEELDRYLVHGILHLLGFDHERGPRHAARMALAEDGVLGAEGMVAATVPAARPAKQPAKAKGKRVAASATKPRAPVKTPRTSARVDPARNKGR
jgi:probable rRNA maturation factor